MAEDKNLDMIAAGLGGLSSSETAVAEVEEVEPEEVEVEEVEENPIGKSGLDALLKIFGETQYQIDLNQAETDWLVDKTEVFKTWIDNALNPDCNVISSSYLNLLSEKIIDVPGNMLGNHASYQADCNSSCFHGIKATSTEILRNHPILSSFGVCRLIPDPEFAPILSVILGHNDRFTVRLDIVINSRTIESKIVIKSNKISKKSIELNVSNFKNADQVTIDGYKLLMEDDRGRQVNSRDIVDVHLMTLAAKNPAYFSKINDPDNVTNAIAIAICHQGRQAVINEFDVDLSSVLDILKRRSVEQEPDTDPVPVSDAWKLLEDSERKAIAARRAAATRLKNTEDLLLNSSYNEIISSYKKILAPQLVSSALIGRIIVAAMQLPTLSQRLGVIRDDLRSLTLPSTSNYFTLYKFAIRYLSGVIGDSVFGDFVMYGADDNEKATYTLAAEESIRRRNSSLEIPPSARIINERTARQLLRLALRASSNENVRQLYSHMTECLPYEASKVVINPKLTKIFARLLNGGGRGSRLRLFRLGKVTEIDGETTQRYCTLHPVCQDTSVLDYRPIVIGATEGTQYYNFVDEGRLAIVSTNGPSELKDDDCVSSILLLDNIGNFVKQAQALISISNSGGRLHSFLESYTPSRGALTTAGVPILWGYASNTAYQYQYQFPSLNVSTNEPNCLRFATLLDSITNSPLKALSSRPCKIQREAARPQYIGLPVKIGAFTGLDASQINFHMNRTRPASNSGGRAAPINYGTPIAQTVEQIQDDLNARLVKSFWKGMDRMSKTGKSFKISPHGGNEVIEFRPDRIIFEDQVLHATNVLLAVPDSIYEKCRSISLDARNSRASPFNRILSKPVPSDSVRTWLTEHNPEVLGIKKKKKSRFLAKPASQPYDVGSYVTQLNKYLKDIKFLEKFSHDIFKDCVDKYRPNTYRTIATDVSSPIGFMFWKPPEDAPHNNNRIYDQNVWRYFDANVCGRLFVQCALLTERFYKHCGNRNETDLVESISGAYVNYLHKDPDAGEWLHADSIAGPDDLDFNTLTEKFIESVCLPFAVIKSSGDFFKAEIHPYLPLDNRVSLCKAIIGQVKCDVSVELSGEKRMCKWYFNNYKVRRDEILQIMKRAMCFAEQKDYDAFIKQVSKLSLRARDLMANGLSVNIAIDKRSSALTETVPVLLEFDKSGKQWQLIIRNPDGTVFKRHDVQGGATKFANLLASQEKARRQGNNRQKTFLSHELISMLQSAPTIGAQSMRRLLATGLRVIDERLARSRLLLENAVKMVKAEYITHTYGNKSLSGYKVTGISGKNYIVCCDKLSGKTSTSNDHGDDKFGAVYALPNLQYVCIVDKSHDQTGYDIIVNRLLALKNDKHVAGSVTTLGKFI